jgi:hypothetical protein
MYARGFHRRDMGNPTLVMVVRSGRRFDVACADLERLRNCIVEHATEGEQRAVERVLATLATAEAAALAAGRETVTFAAPVDTAELVARAARAMARSDRHMERAERRRRSAHAA